MEKVSCIYKSCFIRVICTWDWKRVTFFTGWLWGPRLQWCRNRGARVARVAFVPLPICGRSVNPVPTGGGHIIPTNPHLLLLPSPPIFSPSGITDLGYNIYQLSLFSWNKIINQCQMGKLRWVRNSLKPIAGLTKITYTWRDFVFNPFSPPKSYIFTRP